MKNVLLFLSKYFLQGHSYRSLCGMRSALNNLIMLPQCPDISSHPAIKRYMKGVFEMRMPKPRHLMTWDVSLVFTYLNNLGENDNLSFKQIARKLATILMLLAGTRVDSLHSLSILSMYVSNDEITFIPSRLLKHYREDHVNIPITYRAYPQNAKICPVKAIMAYLHYRLTMSSEPQFFITYGAPHRPAHRDSIARWIKGTLAESGIDTGLYTAHSCRGASTSAASMAGLPLHTILKAAEWSKADTFYKHYKRDIAVAYPKYIQPTDREMDFGTAILNSVNLH